MSAREKLAQELRSASFAHGWEHDGDIHEYIARRLIAAGYRKQRTIETAEDLAGLPLRTIIADAHGRAFQKFTGGWEPTGLSGKYPVVARPATVLWEPEAWAPWGS